MENSVSHRWYVYTYAYPDGAVFYVGKGKGYRINAHLREARKGAKSYKCNVIRKIWREGGKVLQTKVAFFEDEQEAFLFEKQLIAQIGRKNLTNSTDGGEGPSGFRREKPRSQPKMTVAGRCIEIACKRKAQRLDTPWYGWQRLSEDTGTGLSMIMRAITGEQQPRLDSVMKWWNILGDSDNEIRQMFFHALGYATPEEVEQVEAYVEQLELLGE